MFTITSIVIVTLIKNVGKPTFIFTDFLHFILPFTSLGKEFEISQNTIQTWGKKIKYPDKYLKLGKRGRPKEK